MVFTPNFVSVCFTFFFLKKTPDYIKLSPRNLDPSLKVHRCPWNVRGTLWQTHMLSFSLCFPASGLRDFCLSHICIVSHQTLHSYFSRHKTRWLQEDTAIYIHLFFYILNQISLLEYSYATYRFLYISSRSVFVQ